MPRRAFLGRRETELFGCMAGAAFNFPHLRELATIDRTPHRQHRKTATRFMRGVRARTPRTPEQPNATAALFLQSSVTTGRLVVMLLWLSNRSQ